MSLPHCAAVCPPKGPCEGFARAKGRPQTRQSRLQPVIGRTGASTHGVVVLGLFLVLGFVLAGAVKTDSGMVYRSLKDDFKAIAKFIEEDPFGMCKTYD